MIEFTYRPGKPLSEFVRYMWYQEGYKPTGSVERVLPTGSSQIIINLGDNRFRHFGPDLEKTTEYDKLILAGVHTKPVFLDSTTRTSTIGAVLKEGAIPALFGIPAVKFQNQVINLDDLSVDTVSDLKDELITSSQPQQKMLKVESCLCRLLDCSRSPDPAIRFAVARIKQMHGKINISELLETTGYTSRWFIELFRDATGTTPKRFAKLCRFQHALDHLRTKKSPNFAAVALQCGYYDQSHFIHDFRDIGGISPLHYHRNQGESKNHLVLCHT